MQQNTITLLKEALLSITNRGEPLTEKEKFEIETMVVEIIRTFNK